MSIRPGGVSGAYGYRAELTGQRRRLVVLGALAVAGGLSGGLLLLALPPRRPLMLGVGFLIVFMAATGPAADPWRYAGRGWALLLGGWFLGSVALVPTARSRGRARATATRRSAASPTRTSTS